MWQCANFNSLLYFSKQVRIAFKDQKPTVPVNSNHDIYMIVVEGLDNRFHGCLSCFGSFFPSHYERDHG
eukprot:m.332184 g.332184  ORF g.332184 m.332184 type:complete len:69 (-) comp16894_c0_seq1:383-589(-)